ncbi:MAG: hypothetical protein IJV35_07455 [Neisseriaceae bacterium]|nr:hypothetical protein [Neisseriaceae bacterium]
MRDFFDRKNRGNPVLPIGKTQRRWRCWWAGMPTLYHFCHYEPCYARRSNLLTTENGNAKCFQAA